MSGTLERRIRVDGGSELNSALVASTCKKLGIELEKNSPYNPQSIGTAEHAQWRVKRAALIDTITTRAKGTTWLDALPRAVRTVNSARSSSRGQSPFNLMFGRDPNRAIAQRLGLPSTFESEPAVPVDADGAAAFVNTLGSRININIDKANEIRSRRQASNARAQSAHGTDHTVVVGDFVLVANTGRTQHTKFQNYLNHTGPYLVTNVNAQDRRVRLRRVADNVDMKHPTTLNRILKVDRDAVYNTNTLDGETHWEGAGDTSLLLDPQRAAVDKARSVATRAAETERQQTLARAAATAAAEEKRNKHHTAVQASIKARADQRADDNKRRDAIDQVRATQPIPNGAIAIGLSEFVTGSVLALTTNPKDRNNPAHMLFITARHPRFVEMLTAMRAANAPITTTKATKKSTTTATATRSTKSKRR